MEIWHFSRSLISYFRQFNPSSLHLQPPFPKSLKSPYPQLTKNRAFLLPLPPSSSSSPIPLTTYNNAIWRCGASSTNYAKKLRRMPRLLSEAISLSLQLFLLPSFKSLITFLIVFFFSIFVLLCSICYVNPVVSFWQNLREFKSASCAWIFFSH
jgi:hypothetical protein